VPVQVGMTLAEVERRLIAATYRASGTNKRRASATLGIGLRTLYRKLKEYDLE
jgi:DNA-binding NtrC family response regulator